MGRRPRSSMSPRLYCALTWPWRRTCQARLVCQQPYREKGKNNNGGTCSAAALIISALPSASSAVAPDLATDPAWWWSASAYCALASPYWWSTGHQTRLPRRRDCHYVTHYFGLSVTWASYQRRGEAPPADGASAVLLNTAPLAQHQRETAHRDRISTLRSHRVPATHPKSREDSGRGAKKHPLRKFTYHFAASRSFFSLPPWPVSKPKAVSRWAHIETTRHACISICAGTLTYCHLAPTYLCLC